MSISIDSGQQANTQPPKNLEPSPEAKPIVTPRPPAKTPWRAGAIELPVVCSVVAAGLFYGWMRSGEGHLTAEEGLGYYLGIAGSLLMLTLLLYPLRKRFGALRVIGGVRTWFRIHMLLGITGPALILIHSNFSFGSFNSTIALICMLIVAGSGFIGRFLYARVHRGLYGRKAHVREFLSDAGNFRAALSIDEPDGSSVLQILQEFEARRLKPTPRLAAGIGRVITSGFAGRHTRARVMKEIKNIVSQRAVREGWKRSAHRIKLATYRRHLDSYFTAVARAEAFSLYERLFALWHMLHLPLFVILVMAALTHVVAVHLY